MSIPNQPNISLEDDEVDLREIIATILDGKWLILIITLVSIMIAAMYAFGKTPIYRADALLQVEEAKAGIPGIEELTGLGGDNATAGTELEIIKSRKIIGQAVEDLSLDIIATPRRLPLIGNLTKKFLDANEIGYIPPGFSWLSNFSWSYEDIKVNRLEVHSKFLNQPFKLVADDNQGNYSLFFEEKLILQGSINQYVSSENGQVNINIQELHANKGTEFTITKQSYLKATIDLQARIKASEKGKKTGIITLALEGTNQEKIKNILENISNSYLQQNKSRSSEEASNALSFLNEQIKPVKERSDRSEAILKKYRTNNQTADMSMETQSILQVITEIDTELQKFSLKRDELQLKYTENHPTIQALNSQESKLLERRRKTLSKISELPETQQQLLKLEGEYRVANTIYIDLLNKIQEFKIAKASSVGNVYILDTPVVNEKPVKPKKTLVLALGALLGSMFGLLLVLIRKVLYQKISNPEKLEEQLGLPVYATIPLSSGVKLTGGLNKRRKKQKSLLAIEDNNDPAIESLRSLRTSLHFALLEAKNNIVMITGPSPGIGKSFISSNLAAVIAGSDQKVLLIDADMRKGYLHELFNIQISPGLSDLISERTDQENAIHTIKNNDKSFDVLTRGKTPPNPSELLMHSNFESLLNQFSSKYDLIIVDTPPIHAVTDPTIIGSLCGVVFMVIRQDTHAMKEIEYAIKRLEQTGIKTKGFIFNGYKAKKSRYGYGYGYQSYYGDYKSDSKT